ncbi:hypothetical protein C0993_008166 [Termitomyces sp. T159_Od127]|nr:hypothetical protein C0993_008166 [Termitomyces sp. T159_Od127]
MLAESQGALRTRSVQSEVIWALNPTNNISEGLRRYGVSGETTAVLVVGIGAPATGIAGTLVGLDELAEVTDWATAACAMLPKVATQILHSTTRAVSSIKPIRNVLHQSGSSRQNNKGGSARYPVSHVSLSPPAAHSSQGRTVTHASPAFPSHDGAFLQADDQDDAAPRRAPASPARTLSIPARPSVLKTVQLHARARHAFAADHDDAPDDDAHDVLDEPTPPRHVSHAAKRLLEVRHSGNPIRAAEAVRKFRQSTVKPSVREFNAALEALQATRRPGEPLNLILETYNDMLRHSLLPNANTYVALIDCLTARDNEVHSAITALERRINHRALTGLANPAFDQADYKRIDMLRQENNHNTAMSLFESLLSTGGNRFLTGHTYTSLIRSCAINSNIDAAIHIWAQFEKRDDFFPNSAMYLEMIRVYTNAGQLSGAEEVFAEYRDALQRGMIHISWSEDNANPNTLNCLVWNQMIETYFRFDRPEKAIALVEQMLQAEATDIKHHVVSDPPPVSSATFTTVLAGFCDSGDVQTALVWFDRLLAQQPSSSQDPFEPVGLATKPDHVAWRIMVDTLAAKGMITDLNRIFSIRLSTDLRYARVPQRTIVYTANMAHLQSLDDEQCVRTIAWLLADVLNTPDFKLHHRLHFTTDICNAYLDRKMYDKAIGLFSAYVADFLKSTETPSKSFIHAPPLAHVQESQLKFTDKLYQVSKGDVPYHISMELARLAVRLRVTQSPSAIPFFLQSYALARASNTLPTVGMTRLDWELLFMAANTFETLEEHFKLAVPDFAYQGLPSLVRDVAAFEFDFDKLDEDVVRQVIDNLSKQLGTDGMLALLKETGFTSAVKDYIPALDQPLEDSASETSGADSGYASEAPLTLDPYLSRSVMEKIRAKGANLAGVVNSAFSEFKTAVENGKSPHPAALALLLHWLGRMGRMKDVVYTYGVAQRTLQSLENDKVLQTQGWFEIENAMIIALGHYGDIEGAHHYRRRVFAHGGVPSAEAYGVLIHNVKDTTDDASNALELFQESQRYRVIPSNYLYNNIISKLAKARKADYALELFRQMKGLHLSPTSVTFGAVIGACARVGDINSAEALFVEMTKDPNFKPRIPPYNTMMQIYTTIKPDRARALYYYQEMQKAGISPTAHTYKLLLDVYGALEPVDISEMSRIFDELKANKKVAVQGTHYAAMINAYGCVVKDLNQAIKIFTQIHDIPRDAVVYEALFSAFTVHRRADLIRQYLNQMHLEGVHMTAYIANCLIKTYSLLDDMEEARKLFESLQDPPEGVAAPNNHAPHSPETVSAIDPNAPVYREPSTWEAMVRAELGSGNRDGALALLERLKARQVFWMYRRLAWLTMV